MTKLNLQNNMLTTFSSTGLSSALSYLNLADNGISNFISSGLPSTLNTLNLSQNWITNNALMSTNIIIDAPNVQTEDVLSYNCLDSASMDSSFVTWLDAHHMGTPKTWTLTNPGTK